MLFVGERSRIRHSGSSIGGEASVLAVTGGKGKNKSSRGNSNMNSNSKVPVHSQAMHVTSRKKCYIGSTIIKEEKGKQKNQGSIVVVEVDNSSEDNLPWL
ncbi:unnamed protein product [Linum trigynum]|uniref:Uncharacterized protein n=1 Tax=Linum trigynum TaxID=586398 RepID=A0AAV2FCG6_9ROSI